MSEPHRPESDGTSGVDDAAPVPAEWLSALLDGELDSQQAAAACAHWRTDADARACWHRYGLIGDALRSDDLTQPAAGGDAAFLAALRERIAREPVPIRPAAGSDERRPSSPTAPQRLRGWTTPVGVAAGVLVVASLAWMLRPGGGSDDPASERFATTSPAQPGPLRGLLAVQGSTPSERSSLVAGPTTGSPLGPAADPAPIRATWVESEGDAAELQPYLRVHRVYAGPPSARPGIAPARDLQGVSPPPVTR